jgi:hypothetical protein
MPSSQQYPTAPTLMLDILCLVHYVWQASKTEKNAKTGSPNTKVQKALVVFELVLLYITILGNVGKNAYDVLCGVSRLEICSCHLAIAA